MAQIDFRQFGPADFGVAAGVVASLAEEVRVELGGADRELLTIIVYLCWFQAQHGGRGAAYAYPSHSYLAGRIHRSSRQVRRIVDKLVGLGLIAKQNRHGPLREWMSNLYTLGGQIYRSIKGLAKRLFSVPPYGHFRPTNTPRGSIRTGEGTPCLRGGVPPPPEREEVPAFDPELTLSEMFVQAKKIAARER